MKFVCGYCGAEYETIHDRTKCEDKCYRTEQIRIRKEEEEARKKEKDIRSKEIRDVYKNYTELQNAFYKDYGHRVSVTNKNDYADMFDDLLFTVFH